MVDPVTAGTIGCVAAVAAATGGVAVAGFTAAGVAAGSAAAGWMSGIGNVAAGSWFASFQSVGVVGFAKATLGGICSAGAAAGAGVAGAFT